MRIEHSLEHWEVSHDTTQKRSSIFEWRSDSHECLLSDRKEVEGEMKKMKMEMMMVKMNMTVTMVMMKMITMMVRVLVVVEMVQILVVL